MTVCVCVCVWSPIHRRVVAVNRKPNPNVRRARVLESSNYFTLLTPDRRRRGMPRPGRELTYVRERREFRALFFSFFWNAKERSLSRRIVSNFYVRMFSFLGITLQNTRRTRERRSYDRISLFPLPAEKFLILRNTRANTHLYEIYLLRYIYIYIFSEPAHPRAHTRHQLLKIVSQIDRGIERMRTREVTEVV